MKKLIALFLILFILVLLTACKEGINVPVVSMNVHIYGIVTDVADGSPISDAYVILAISYTGTGGFLGGGTSTHLQTFTNGEGFYSFKKSYSDSSGWQSAKKRLTVSAAGYKPLGEVPYTPIYVSSAEVQEINIQKEKIED